MFDYLIMLLFNLVKCLYLWCSITWILIIFEGFFNCVIYIYICCSSNQYIIYWFFKGDINIIIINVLLLSKNVLRISHKLAEMINIGIQLTSFFGIVHSSSSIHNFFFTKKVSSSNMGWSEQVLILLRLRMSSNFFYFKKKKCKYSGVIIKVILWVEEGIYRDWSDKKVMGLDLPY